MTSELNNSAKDDSAAWPQLMLAAQGGDAASYQRLLREITPPLRAFLRARFFAREHIDDIVQEILLAIHAARHTYRPEQPFRNWMYGVARHKMIDYLRKYGRKTANEINDDELVTFMRDTANTPEEAMIGKDVKQALAQLPEKQREVLLMTRVEGLSMAEAGKKLGMTETAVKVTAHRATKKMKEWLLEYGY